MKSNFLTQYNIVKLYFTNDKYLSTIDKTIYELYISNL